MKTYIAVSLLFVLGVLALPMQSAQAEVRLADDISGKWILTVDVPGEPVDVVLELKQDGDAVTGTMSSTHGGGKITKGTFKDKKLAATLAADVQGSSTEIQLDGAVDGEKIAGSLTAVGLGTFGFAGSRAK